MPPILALTLALGTAWASPSYPAALQDAAGMACSPSCVVCHATAAGGGGTANQPFTGALVARGLVGGGADSTLVSALAQLDADGVDTDGDGVTDLDALAAGADPNGGADLCGAGAPTGPTYGCVQAAPGPTVPLLAALAVLLAASRRRGAPAART
jgi:hypothetical protein